MLYFSNQGKIDPKSLSSKLFTDYSKQINPNGTFKIWFCNKKSLQKVRGGLFGEQVIRTNKFKDSVLKKIQGELSTVDKLTGLKVIETSQKRNSNIRVYIDRDIDLGMEEYLGITVYNHESRTSSANWEVFLNQSTMKSENKMIYTALHEIGHTLGLEHPHDDSDQDFHKSTSATKSAKPRQTVMSYGRPSWGIYPNRYTINDIRALQYTWGEQNGQEIIAQRPIKPRLEIPQIIDIAHGIKKDLIISGEGAPNSIIKVTISNEIFDEINTNRKGKWDLILNKKYIRKHVDHLGALLQLTQHDEFGHINRSDPYFLNFLGPIE